MRNLLPLLVLWGLCWGAGASPLQVPGQFPASNQVYTSQEPAGGTAVLAPNAALRPGALLLAAQPGRQAQPEACAAACRALTDCSWFEYCQNQDGCTLGQSTVADGGCRLYAANCKQPEQLKAETGVVSGFPVRLPEITVAGYATLPGQGIAGADYVCGASVVPGKCALRSTEEALVYCLATAECRAVTIFSNGTDGCSGDTLNFLKTEGPLPTNTFVASGVFTLQLPEIRDVLDTQLTESEGQVIVPSDAELAAAPTNVDPATDTTWRGCLLGNATVMAGKVLTVLSNVPTAEDCCRECRKRYAPGGCNVWNYCGQAGGCSYKGPEMVQQLTMQTGQCQLRYQELVSPAVGWAPALLAHGDGVPFTAGAPLAVSGPAAAAVPGWQPLPGRGILQASTAAVCTVDGLSQESRSQCVESMNSIDAMAGWCMSEPLCAAFTPHQGDSDPAPEQGVFQTVTNSSDYVLVPSGIMFVKEQQPQAPSSGGSSSGSSDSGNTSSSGGGGPLSSGIVAAIAVAAAAGGAAAGLSLFLALRARKRRKALHAAKAKGKSSDEDEYSGAEKGGLHGGKGGGGKGGSDDGSKPLAAAAQQQEDGQRQIPVQVLQIEHEDAAQLRQLQGISGGAFVPLSAPQRQGSGEVGERRQSSDTLLSPFAVASMAFGSGVGTPGPPSRAGSVPQPSGMAPGELTDCLGQALPGVHSPLAACSSGKAAAAAFARSGRAGSAPVPPGARQWRPPLPPMAATRSGSLGSGGLQLLPAGSLQPAGSLASPQQLPPPGAASLLPASSLGPQTPKFWDAHDAHTLGLLQPAGSGSGGTIGSSASPAGHPPILRTQRTASSGLLPELAQHVAAQEAAAHDRAAEELSMHLPALSEASLPPRLLEWLVDPAEVSYQRWPNGRLRDLGSGASGQVFKATFRGETVAAKEMDLGINPAAQEAFINEAMKLQALRHPNIMGLYGVCLAGDRGIVLLEYCEGRDLHSALNVTTAGGSLRLFSWHRRGRRVALEICKAVNYLHTKGVVHMDIKSSNVLLTSGGTAKLADVAFSRELIGEVLPDVPLVGTFPWIAPEVLLGAREVTTAVDIFSFGVVLWEIVTGEMPRRGAMRMPLVPDECPQDVCDLIMECLSEDPIDRPTASQLLRRLSGMLERSASISLVRARSMAVEGSPAAKYPYALSPSPSARPGLALEGANSAVLDAAITAAAAGAGSTAASPVAQQHGTGAVPSPQNRRRLSMEGAGPAAQSPVRGEEAPGPAVVRSSAPASEYAATPFRGFGLGQAADQLPTATHAAGNAGSAFGAVGSLDLAPSPGFGAAGSLDLSIPSPGFTAAASLDPSHPSYPSHGVAASASVPSQTTMTAGSMSPIPSPLTVSVAPQAPSLKSASPFETHDSSSPF